MPTSALVVHLDSNDADRAEFLAALPGRPEFEVGACSAGRLALALCTESERRDVEAWRWLQSWPVVRHVDVVLVCFDSDAPGGDE